jgi:hypothetical protein
MTLARNLKRSDKLDVLMNLEVLSVERIHDGLIRIKAAAVEKQSLRPGDDSGMLEFICKPYRNFSAHPYRGDGGGGCDGDDLDIDPLVPNNLEPVG